MRGLGPGSNWSKAEIEAAIDLYFVMLDGQLRGMHVVKMSLYREFMARFPQRSRQSVERKCQNIAACLVQCGMPIVTGLVPLFNVQAALVDSVVSRLDTRADLLQECADRPLPATVPFSPTAGVEVPPPFVPPDPGPEPESARQVRRKIDYVAREQANRSLGHAGEIWTIEYERRRLHDAGHVGLSRKVRHASLEDGDGAGYDVESFDLKTGQSVVIEVKTTRASIWTPFYLTPNEVNVSESLADQFRLYRLHAFGERTRLYVLQGSLRSSCDLRPQAYRAMPIALAG